MKIIKKFIVWNEKWNTGIKKIDEQHHHFVGLINRTHLLNLHGKTGEKIEVLLNDLTEYARIHFSTEEQYFVDTDYPGAEEHIKKHGQLLKKVIDFNGKFEKENESSKIAEELLHFLRDWLDNHLIKVDHKYIPWLTEHGIS